MARRIALLVVLLLASPLAAAGEAKGSIAYKGRTLDVKYAYLVTTKDAMSGKSMRRVILAPKDMGAKVTSCAKMSCVDGDLDDAMELDFVDGPRINYWLVMNGQKIQYSGTQPKDSLASTADDAKKVAGTLKFDGTAAGGPKVDVTFDASFVKDLQ